MVGDVPDDAAKHDRRAGRERQIDPDREGKTRHPAQLQHHGDEHADQHQPPRQALGHDALDDERHQHRLGRAEFRLHLLAVVAPVDLAVDARVLEVLDAAAVVDEVLAGGSVPARLAQPDHVVRIVVAVRIGAAQVFLLAAEFRGRELHVVIARREDGSGVVELEDHEAEHQRGGERAAEDGDLLPRRRGADQVPGLEVLGGAAAVGDGHADDGGDAQGRDLVRRSDPPQSEKDERGDQQRRHGHAGDGVRRAAYLAGQARADGHEEEPENEDEQRSEDVELERGNERADDHDQERPDRHHRQRDVPIGAQRTRWTRGSPQRAHAAHRAAHDGGQGLEERDDASGRYGACADIQNI